MKSAFIILAILLSSGAFGQDTLVHHSGKIEAVQILEIDKESNIIVFKKSSDIIYASSNNFKEIRLYSDLTKNNVIQNNLPEARILNVENEEFKTEINRNYGKYSVSTNLTALIPFRFVGNRITIEPEYRFNESFSLKIPLSIGLPRSYNSNYSYPPYLSSNYTDYSALPTIQEYSYYSSDRPEHVIFQTGINPKYYLNGKYNEIFSLYLGAAVNFGIAKDIANDYFFLADTVNNEFSNELYWISELESTEKRSGQYTYVNFEGLLGVDYNFSERLTATFETGYSSDFFGTRNTNNRAFVRTPNSEYELIYDEVPQLIYENHRYLKARILLTYHF